MNEAETRTEHIDLALSSSGWGVVDGSRIRREYKIAELSLFGSALRDDFGPESDVDLAVEFEPESHWSLWDFYTLQEELEELFGRDVDLA